MKARRGHWISWSWSHSALYGFYVPSLLKSSQYLESQSHFSNSNTQIKKSMPWEPGRIDDWHKAQLKQPEACSWHLGWDSLGSEPPTSGTSCHFLAEYQNRTGSGVTHACYVEMPESGEFSVLNLVA